MLKAALVKVCTNAEPAFDISEQEAIEGRTSLLMQELGEGEDYQCKGEAAERFGVVLLIKNFEKEKIQTKDLTWSGTKCPKGHGAELAQLKKNVFLMKGKYSKTVLCINFFLLCKENQENVMSICGIYGLLQSFFCKTVYNLCTYIIVYPSWSFHEDIRWREPFIWLIFICTLIPLSVPLQTNCVCVCPSL